MISRSTCRRVPPAPNLVPRPPFPQWSGNETTPRCTVVPAGARAYDRRAIHSIRSIGRLQGQRLSIPPASLAENVCTISHYAHCHANGT